MWSSAPNEASATALGSLPARKKPSPTYLIARTGCSSDVAWPASKSASTIRSAASGEVVARWRVEPERSTRATATGAVGGSSMRAGDCASASAGRVLERPAGAPADEQRQQPSQLLAGSDRYVPQMRVEDLVEAARVRGLIR